MSVASTSMFAEIYLKWLSEERIYISGSLRAVNNCGTGTRKYGGKQGPLAPHPSQQKVRLRRGPFDVTSNRGKRRLAAAIVPEIGRRSATYVPGTGKFEQDCACCGMATAVNIWARPQWDRRSYPAAVG